MEIKILRPRTTNCSFIYVCGGLMVLLLCYNISKLKGNPEFRSCPRNCDSHILLLTISATVCFGEMGRRQQSEKPGDLPHPVIIQSFREKG